MQHLEASIGKFEEVAIEQEHKGMEKYGQPLDPLDRKYDWLEMAAEELVDAFKYLHAEQKSREDITSQIRETVKFNTIPMVYDKIDALLIQLEGK